MFIFIIIINQFSDKPRLSDIKKEESVTDKFLTLMADLDDGSQNRLSEWYGSLKNAGFIGTQTPGLPYHIRLSKFPPDRESEAVNLMKKAAFEFPKIPIHISHIGIFAGGNVALRAGENRAA